MIPIREINVFLTLDALKTFKFSKKNAFRILG